MTDDRLQRLSALMDDQLAGDTAARKLEELLQDDAERATWSRYHLIGDVIGDRNGPIAAGNLAARVSLALQHEPTVLAPRRRHAVPLARTLGGLAVAASVAVMAVLGLRSVRQDVIDLQAPQMASAAAPGLEYIARAKPVSPHISTVSTGDAASYRPEHQNRWDAKRPEVIYRLDDYLRDHSALAAREGVQGALSYRRIAIPAGKE